MDKKLFWTSVASVFAVVAFAAIPGGASAAEFGNCVAKGPAGNPCITGHVFTPYPAATAVGTTTKKVPFSGNIIIASEANPANGIECTKLSGQGIVINIGFGHSEQNLVLEGCSGVGALAFCQNEVAGHAQKINGTGKIEGEIEGDATGSFEQEVVVKSGFLVTCAGEEPGKTVNLGHVQGKLAGKLREVQPWELEFNKAKGLIFNGEASTLTGTSETAEAYSPRAKVYQSPEKKVETLP